MRNDNRLFIFIYIKVFQIGGGEPEKLFGFWDKPADDLFINLSIGDKFKHNSSVSAAKDKFNVGVSSLFMVRSSSIAESGWRIADRTRSNQKTKSKKQKYISKIKK